MSALCGGKYWPFCLDDTHEQPCTCGFDEPEGADQ